jgi:hypothetical protein
MRRLTGLAGWPILAREALSDSRPASQAAERMTAVRRDWTRSGDVQPPRRRPVCARRSRACSRCARCEPPPCAWVYQLFGDLSIDQPLSNHRGPGAHDLRSDDPRADRDGAGERAWQNVASAKVDPTALQVELLPAACGSALEFAELPSRVDENELYDSIKHNHRGTTDWDHGRRRYCRGGVIRPQWRSRRRAPTEKRILRCHAVQREVLRFLRFLPRGSPGSSVTSIATPHILATP